MKPKEFEIREELALEYKAKEIELIAAKGRSSETDVTPFDVGKYIRFVQKRWKSISILCILKKLLVA